MIRDKKSMIAPSQDQSPSKTRENKHHPALKTHNPLKIEINSTAHNNHNLVSFDTFGHYIADCDEDAANFLPSPSFDDLQSSIFSSSNELHIARGEDSSITAQQKLTSQKQFGCMAPRMTPDVKTSISPRSQPDSSPIKSSTNSLRQGSSNRQSIATSTTSKFTDPSNTYGTARARRQSLYPFSAGAAIVNAAKASRKSLVPSLPDAESSKFSSSNRRPFSASASQALEEKGISSNKTKSGNLKGLTTARAAKAKSLQPSPKNGQNSQGISNFETQKAFALANKSQSRLSEKETMQSSARNRMSIVPGMPSQSHPTGLGAKTVSPTDTRRVKRLSALQNASLAGSTPPTPQSDTTVNGISSRSSSILPTKVPTPTPSHTSPDSNRKSYNVGLSPPHAPAPNYNAVHESSGSMSLRLPPSVSSRNLPNRSRSLHGLNGNEEEKEDSEFVPPIPEIPKAFESPKECPTEYTSFSNRKSSLPLEPNSHGNMSFYNYSDSSLLEETSRTIMESKIHGIEFSDFKLSNDISHKKKTLQPLRLPPFNLRPLSSNTATKVEAQEDTNQIGNYEVNLNHQSGSMTESKSTFFGNKNDSGKSFRSPTHSRSSSAIHFLRSTPHLNLSFSSKPIATTNEVRPSGYQSATSSIQKNSVDYGCLPRSKMSDDPLIFENLTEQQKAPRITSLRAINSNKRSSVGEPPPAPQPSSEDSSISTSSLRRKLSLGWKRTTSKGSVEFPTVLTEHESAILLPVKKPNIGSPPRVPSSANLINSRDGALPSPSLSIKTTTYVDFKRRKSSASSLSMFSSYHDRTISESWSLQNCPNKNSNLNPERSAPTNRTSSMMHRILNPRESTASARPVDQWTVDLDRDDLTAEDEMKKLASKRKDTELAARQLEALRKRAIPKEHISPQEAIRNGNLNIFERGEVVDYKDVYFCGTIDAIKHIGELTSDNVNFGYDDDRGDYNIVKGDHLSYRYEIIDLLGKGSFGQVVRCVDHKTGGLAAVKIIRNKKRFHQQALVEVKILQKLRDWDPKSKYSMVRFIQSFYFRGHLCISAELLDMNLYELIKSNSFRGFSLKIVRRFTKQILNSLLLLQQNKVIHCDLKPENVLLVHPLHSEIKVIDFGSSCFENEKVYTYIQSRFYRSPEVILGMTYGMAIDMWSLGCIMAELYSGVPIFPGENEQEQLACIMEVFGPPEKHLIEKSTRRKLFFDSVGKPRLTVSSKGRRRRPSSKTLQQVLKCDDLNFLDFLTKCLRWDPERRMKPDEAICHEFITGRKPTPPSTSSRYSSHRNDSSNKRNSAVTLAPGNRPLPEPPFNSHKSDTINKSHETPSHKKSPTKTPGVAGSLLRRQSAINDNLSSQNSKRQGHGLTNSTGTNGSILPRISKNSNGKANAINVSSSSYHGNESHIGLTQGSAAGVVGARRVQ